MKSYTTKPETTKQWILTASIDGNMVDYEEIIESENEPDFWTCYNIAYDHGCDFFSIEELETEVIEA